MKRTMTLLLLSLAAAAMIAPAAIAQNPPPDLSDQVRSPAEIVALGAAPDGARVTVRGEAIGDIIRAGGGGAWLNVLGDGTALGLWAEDPSLWEAVDTLGDYHHRGTIVEAVGVYNAACDVHGGDRDVHVVAVTIVEPGERIDHPLQLWKLPLGLGLIGTAGVLWVFHKRRTARLEL